MAVALQQNVLVLNKNWQPINITSAFDAICDVFSGKADIIHSDYTIHNFDSWVENWEDALSLAEVAQERVIECQRYNLVVPEIIKVKEYSGFLVRRAKLSRGAIVRRDNHTCQYCGKHCKGKDMTLDHIFPRSRGGKSSWMNLVLSCVRCNSKKADRTPEEAGMKLRRPPFEPHWSCLKNNFSKADIPKSWEDFIGKMYWNAELEP